jgi:hypothetical protein
MPTNYTKLADLYAIAKAEEDAAAKRAKALREQILETGREILVGDAYTVTVSLYETTSIVRGEVEKLLTPEQMKRCQKVGTATRLNVKAGAFAIAAE